MAAQESTTTNPREKDVPPSSRMGAAARRTGLAMIALAMTAGVVIALRGADQVKGVVPRDVARRKGAASATAETTVVLAVMDADPMVLLPVPGADLAVRDVVPELIGLVDAAAWSSGWTRSTASSTKSFARLKPSSGTGAGRAAFREDRRGGALADLEWECLECVEWKCLG